MIAIHRPQACRAVRLHFAARPNLSKLATTNLETFITLPSKIEKPANYFSQLSVQPFRFGHKLQFLIEKSFFLGFADGLGLVSTRISAGSSDSGHLTILFERNSFPIGMNTYCLPIAILASVENRVFMVFLL
jgi:hypothetical protein